VVYACLQLAVRKRVEVMGRDYDGGGIFWCIADSRGKPGAGGINLGGGKGVRKRETLVDGYWLPPKLSENRFKKFCRKQNKCSPIS
jgi:hypothetical protein